MVEKWKNSKLMILLLTTGAVYFFLKFLAPLFAPVIVAMLFVTIAGPLLKKMGKWKINRQVGAILLLLAVGSIIGLLIWIMLSWIVGSVPAWMGGLDSLEADLGRMIHRICKFVGRIPGIDSVYLEELFFLQIQEGIDYVQGEIVPGVLSLSLQYGKLALSAGAFSITFLIATVLLAKDYDKIMNFLLEREDCHVLLEVICGVIRYIATFVKAQLIIISVIGGVGAVVLGIAGIQHGMLWGLVAGILDVFPFVGTGIVLVPLAVQQLFLGRYVRAVICIVTYGVCIFVRELLEPKLIGKRVGVPPIAILMSIYVGLKLFGAWGIVAGPLGFVMIYYIYISFGKRIGQEKKV